MNLSVAAAQYPITEHKGFSDWQAHIAHWVTEAVKLDAQLLLFPEYGSMELVSIFPEEKSPLQCRELFAFQKFHTTLLHYSHCSCSLANYPFLP
jgi:predicted amidohydrolase